MPRRCLALLPLLPVLFPPAAAQIVYASRTYARTGPSYRQLASLDPRTGQKRALTTSARHHRSPVCSADGNTVWFLSSGKISEEWPDRELWALDRRTGTERLLYSLEAARSLDDYWRAGFGSMQRVLGGAPGGAVLLLQTEEPGGAIYRFDGRAVRLARACDAWLRADGSAVAYKPCASTEVRVMDAKGKPLAKLGGCAAAFWSADGAQLACTGTDAVRIFDARTWREVRTVPLAKAPVSSACFAWSPDGLRFLCAGPGRESNSTVRYADYSVLDLAARRWQVLPEGGNQAFWADADHIVYVTPRELAATGRAVGHPAGKLLGTDGRVTEIGPGTQDRQVWTTHLKSVEVPALRIKALTSGLEWVGDPAPCGIGKP